MKKRRISFWIWLKWEIRIAIEIWKDKHSEFPIDPYSDTYALMRHHTTKDVIREIYGTCMDVEVEFREEVKDRLKRKRKIVYKLLKRRAQRILQGTK